MRKTFVGDDVEELPLLVDEYSLDFVETGLVDVPNWLEVAPAHVRNKDDFLTRLLLERFECTSALGVDFETVLAQKDHALFTDDPRDHPNEGDTADNHHDNV